MLLARKHVLFFFGGQGVRKGSVFFSCLGPGAGRLGGEDSQHLLRLKLGSSSCRVFSLAAGGRNGGPTIQSSNYPRSVNSGRVCTLETLKHHIMLLYQCSLP